VVGKGRASLGLVRHDMVRQGGAWFFNLLWQQSFLKKLIWYGMDRRGGVRFGKVGWGMVR